MSAITDIVTKVREAGRRALARPVGYVGAEWERLAPRQRRLIAAALATATCLIAIFGAWIVFSDISDLEEDNAAIREALKSIATNRDLYLDAKSRSAAQEARIGGDPPQLTGDIEAAAHEEQIEIAESSERPTTPAGRVRRRAAALLAAVRATLEGGIARRGTTLRDYVDADGFAGDNAAALLVYGREGQPCSACGAPIRRRVDAARSTFYCPRCQRP